MYVRSRQVAQVCNSCVMRILEPRFTAALLKGDLKISFYRVVEEGFHKHLARVYARGIRAFLFFPFLCVLFSFFLFLYTQCCETHNCRQRQSDVRMIIYDHVRPISPSFASNEKIYIQHFIHHHPVSFQCAKKIASRSKRCRLAKMERINSRNVRATFEFESVSKPRGILQGWDYHVHTYMEQRSVSPWIPLPILIGNFSRPSTRGRREGEGARRDYIGMDCA